MFQKPKSTTANVSNWIKLYLLQHRLQIFACLANYLTSSDTSKGNFLL